MKGWVLAMLASLRVAPVPLRAFGPPCAAGGIDHRSAPRNGPFSLTKECSIDHDDRALAPAKGYKAGEHLAEAMPQYLGSIFATSSATCGCRRPGPSCCLRY